MKAAPSSPISDALRQWITALAILGTFAVNVWSNLFPINGITIGGIANTLFSNVRILPANYAFSIWGVIYLGLIAYGLYQLLPAQRHHSTLRQVDYFLIVACVAQAIWVVLFLLRQFWWSVVAMAAILLPLMAIYRLVRGQLQGNRAEKWCVQVPFSIYLSWISVATIVNVTIALYSSGWTGWGIAPSGWTIGLLIISTAIAAFLCIQWRDIAYPLVAIWALVAIAVRQADDVAIAGSASGLAILLTVLIVIIRLRSVNRRTEAWNAEPDIKPIGELPKYPLPEFPDDRTRH